MKPKKAKNIFRSEIVSNLLPVRFGALVLFASHSLFLVFEDTFGLTLLSSVFLAGWLQSRWAAAPQHSVAALRSWRSCGQLCAFHHVQCPPSSFLPSSSQRWVEAASFLHGVCGRDSTCQPIPLRSAQTGPSLP